MFFALHFPIADGRRLFAESAGSVLERPNWLSPKPGEHFVRLFGSIKDRATPGIVHWAGESAFAESRRGLRIEPGSNPQPRIAYRRLFSDGVATAHYDIGLEYREQYDVMSDLIPRVMQTSSWVPIGPDDGEVKEGWTKATVPLHESGVAIATAYALATTKRQPPSAPTSLVEAGTPVLVLETPWPEDLIDDGVQATELRPGVWHARQPLPSNTHLHVWLLDSNQLDGDELRRLRIHFSRIHISRETLRLVLGWLGEDASRSTTPLIRPVLRQAERLLRRESLAGFDVSETLKAAYEWELLVSPTDYPNMFLQLGIIDARLARQIDEAVRRPNIEHFYQLQVEGSQTGDISIASHVHTKGVANMADSAGDKVEINVTGSTTGHITGIVKGSRDVLNQTEGMNPELQSALLGLLDAVESTEDALPPEDRQAIAEDIEAITQEAKKDEPLASVLSGYLDRIKQVAEKVGEVALPIVSAVTAVLKVLG